MVSYTLPALPYAYEALEPSISREIMTLHHTKHHATYVNNLNKFEGEYTAALAGNDVKKQIALQSAIKFNGGGHINHSLFWENLAPANTVGGKFPTSGALFDLANAEFGGLEGLKKAMTASALAIQGSGWVWLGYNPATKRLEITSTANQDPLLVGSVLVGIDLWEHAYYIDWRNDKNAYLENLYKIVNWTEAEKRLTSATSGSKL